jgi:asparagine synthase (glutamine-hydrolysing)
VVVVAGPGEDRERAARRASQAFRSASSVPELFVDGPLAIAFVPEPTRSLYVSDTIVCLVDGQLYAVPGEVSHTPDPRSAATRLAAAYERSGDAALGELRGEFWAWLWRRRDRRGLALADHVGTRGPYWARDGGTAVVASEIAELLASLTREPAPDPVTLAHWLMITGPKTGTTLFAGVRSIAAGHCLKLAPGDCRTERYWTPTYRDPLRAPRAEQAAQLRDRLDQAVRRRRAATEGTGVLLSGGLDSSTVAALAAQHGDLSAYSAVFPDHPGMDESALIDRTAGALGIPSKRIVVRDGSTLRGALEYTRHWQVPPTSPNLFFWNPLLAQAAADGIEIMLDGEGGDELFAFSPYLVADRLRAGRLFSALELTRRWPGETRPPARDLVRLRLRLAGAMALMPPATHRWSRRLRGLEHYVPAWLPSAVGRQWLDSETSSFAWKRLGGPRWWAYIVELVTRGAGPSAVYEQSRRRSRLAGVLASHPLVDVDVIELVLRLDPELSFDPRFTRTMLREAIDGLVPDEVRLRRGKSNFDALFHQLLAGPELAAVRTLLDPSQARLRGYVDVSSLHRELFRGDPRSHPEGLMRWAIRVWRLATAEIWLRLREDPAADQRLQVELGLPTLAPKFDTTAGG